MLVTIEFPSGQIKRLVDMPPNWSALQDAIESEAIRLRQLICGSALASEISAAQRNELEEGLLGWFEPGNRPPIDNVSFRPDGELRLECFLEMSTT